jgi:prevent-host-death family protein
MDEMGIEEARLKLGDIVDRARLAEEATMITRHGKPAAVVVPVGWWLARDGLVRDLMRDAQAARRGVDGLIQGTAERG